MRSEEREVTMQTSYSEKEVRREKTALENPTHNHQGYKDTKYDIINKNMGAPSHWLRPLSH